MKTTKFEGTTTLYYIKRDGKIRTVSVRIPADVANALSLSEKNNKINFIAPGDGTIILKLSQEN